MSLFATGLPPGPAWSKLQTSLFLLKKEKGGLGRRPSGLRAVPVRVSGTDPVGLEAGKPVMGAHHATLIAVHKGFQDLFMTPHAGRCCHRYCDGQKDDSKAEDQAERRVHGSGPEN